MRRFIFQLLAFLLLQAAVLALLQSRYDVSREANYLAATVDKHRRLRTLPPPRILLVGGSNVAMGLESDRIERALGRPVVNMGLAAGLGVEFMLAEIEPALRKGDIVVLSPEYDHFARGPKGGQSRGLGFDPEVLQQVLIFRPAGVFNLGPTHLRKMVLDRGLAMLGEISRRALAGKTAFTAPKNGPAQSERQAFNAWGDFVGHRGTPPRATPETVDAGRIVADGRAFPSSALLRSLRRFVERAERKGIQVAFSFAPKPAGPMRRDGELAMRLANSLRQIPDLILLDTPQDQTYPPEQFFDTANHLTAEGAAARATRLVDSLRRFIAEREQTRIPRTGPN